MILLFFVVSKVFFEGYFCSLGDQARLSIKFNVSKAIYEHIYYCLNVLFSLIAK